jgi:hypothetical protein
MAPWKDKDVRNEPKETFPFGNKNHLPGLIGWLVARNPWWGLAGCLTGTIDEDRMFDWLQFFLRGMTVDWLAGTIGEDHSFPGVSPLGSGPYHHHKFYQWVIFFLTLQVKFR